MRGSILIIDLPGPVAAEQVTELSAVLRGLAARFEEPRVGSYDVDISPRRLGVAGPDDRNGSPRTFTISIAGPGFGDEGVFRAEHAEDPDLEPLIGFTPTHDVVLVTRDGSRIDRLMIAELGAIVQEVVGGLADVGVSSRLVDEVRGLPGVVAVCEQGRPRVFGGADFLRAWAASPGFWQFAVVSGPPKNYL